MNKLKAVSIPKELKTYDDVIEEIRDHPQRFEKLNGSGDWIKLTNPLSIATDYFLVKESHNLGNKVFLTTSTYEYFDVWRRIKNE